MKGRRDLVSGWLRKADSDRVAMNASAQSGALDAACFHAQQAAEKYLKAYLVACDRELVHTHNLFKLLNLCSEVDPAFGALSDAAELLTPFAVEVRYDTEFWPTEDICGQARNAADRIAQFVGERISRASQE